MFSDFCEEICTDIETAAVALGEPTRIFLWDNLRTHHAPLVTHTVLAREGPSSPVSRMPSYDPIYDSFDPPLAFERGEVVHRKFTAVNLR